MAKIPKVRILSIDGGGIRGILPGMIIANLEHRIQRLVADPAARIVDYIDFIAGTSTGGIIASALLVPATFKGVKPKFSASEVVDFYFDHGPRIFKRSLWDKVKSLGGLRDQKYSSDYLKSALLQQFRERTLKELIRPCIVTGYDIERRTSRFFAQHKALHSPGEEFPVWNIALATASAPTYFEPAHIRNLAGEQFAIVDGGVFANNPAMCAYAEARKLNFNGSRINYRPTAKDMLLISIGTGSVKKSYMYADAKNWGAVNWVRPVVDIMMSGNAETVTHQLKQLFAAADNPAGFIRLEPILNVANSAMDDASEANLENLRRDALSFIHDNNDSLEALAIRLVHE